MTRLWRGRGVVVNTSHKLHGVFGWEVCQVSTDDKPRSEKSRSLNVSIKLIYLNKTSKKKFQSNDNSVWYKLYIMYWNQINTVWHTQRIVWKFPEYSLNMMYVGSKTSLLWFWNSMIIYILYKPYFINDQIILKYQTNHTLGYEMYKLYSAVFKL